MVDGKSSRPAQVTSGVLQGTVLGPLLFLVYINDLPKEVNSTSRLFADDCLLYRTIRSEADTIQLQEDLDRLQMWEKNWLMSFNPDKCEVMRITNKRKTINASYSIHGQVLQMTDNAKYLGITIDSKISWRPHISNITKKATKHLSLSSKEHLHYDAPCGQPPDSVTISTSSACTEHHQRPHQAFHPASM